MGNSQDIASGFSSSHQAIDLNGSPLHGSEDTYLSLYSKFEVVLAEARWWMEHNPGQKVESGTLEGASRQVDKHSWECIGCGETRKRREQIANHIRGVHLDNRGFYHCDAPGWYVTLLHTPDYVHRFDRPFPLAPFRSTAQAT